MSKSWIVSISYQVLPGGERLHKDLETEEREGEKKGRRENGEEISCFR